MCEKRNVFKRFWSQARKKWKFRFEFFFFSWRGKTIVLRNIKFFPGWMACKFKNPIFVRFLGSNLIRRFLSSNIFKRGHISMFVYYIWCRRQIVCNTFLSIIFLQITRNLKVPYLKVPSLLHKYLPCFLLILISLWPKKGKIFCKKSIFA